MNNYPTENEGLYQRVVSAYTAADLEINLTRDMTASFHLRDGDVLYKLADLPVPGRIREFTDRLMAMTVSDNIEKAKRFGDIKNMLRMYSDGVRDSSVEIRVRAKSGKEVWLRERLLFLRESKDDDVIGIITLRDITKRRETELENDRNSDLIEALTREYTTAFSVDVIRDTYEIFRMDTAFRKGFMEVLLPSYSASIHKFAVDHVHPNDREEFLANVDLDYVKSVLADHPDYSFTFRIMDEEQGPVYYRGIFVRIGTEKDPLREIIAAFANIHKERKEEIQRQRLLEEALLRARKADNAKSAFLSNMSHDIRTPMTSIIGLTAIARENADNPDRVRECMDQIRTSGQHLLQLIGNVLDMTRIESGHLDMDESWNDIHQIMKDSVDMVRIAAGEKNIAIDLDISRKFPKMIYCDKLRMTQLLVNLVSNAVKYTNRGGHVGVHGDVGTKPVSGNATCTDKCSDYSGEKGILIRVEDDGIGMDERFMEKLFTPFEREHNSTMSKVSGTGLGLSICKGIVERMDGVICVWSKPGKGSTFVVWLPMAGIGADDSEPAKENAQAIEEYVSEPEQVSIFAAAGRRRRTEGLQKKGGMLHLLLVEDNTLNREIIAEILEDEGYVVDTAEDGLEAVNRIAGVGGDSYDAVLMDLQMPVMDGYEATRTIRAMEGARGAVPIIAMTADAFEEDRKRCREAEMDAYISKPVEMDALRYVIEHMA